MKEKTYIISIEIKFENVVTATNKKNAIAILKDVFREEHNIELAQSEIKSVIIDEKKGE